MILMQENFWVWQFTNQKIIKEKEKKSKLLAQSHWSCYMIYWAKRASLFQPRPSDFAYLPVPKRMIIGVWPAYGE